MSPIHSTLSQIDARSESIPGGGPDAHEDLTIADYIHWLRARGETRPAQLCFRTGDGASRWLPRHDVARFVREHGAEHPSDYVLNHGTDWERDLFG
ncbi:MAG: hypothetical protein ABIT37_09835 [Luteolibacter sp.]